MIAVAAPITRLRWYEYALALLPLPLAVTGAIGLGIGPAACALNLAVMRLKISTPFRVIAVLATTIGAFVAWAVVCRAMI